jgi:hypothetical protein
VPDENESGCEGRILVYLDPPNRLLNQAMFFLRQAYRKNASAALRTRIVVSFRLLPRVS